MCTAVYCGDPPSFDPETCSATMSDVDRDSITGLYEYNTAIDYVCHDTLKFYDGHSSKRLLCLGNGHWSDTDVSCTGKLNKRV
jgi:hypothetical protein